MFNLRKLEQRAHWIFPAPAVFAVVIAVVFPLIYTFWMSFHNWSGQSTQDPIWVGLDNYRQALFHDQRFWGAVVRTLYFTALALTFQVTTGVAIAVLMHREFPGRSIFRTIMLLPMVTTPVVVALTWTLILNPIQGIGPYLWNELGLSQVEWLANPRVVIFTLALVDTWQWTPLIALITLAGLAALPTEPLEASIIDGANAWQTFWHITLPLLRPAIMVATLFRAIDAIKTFDIIFAMTQGGPGNASETLNIYVFQMAFSYQRIGFASALLVLFFILVLMISLMLIRLRRSSW